MVTRAFSVEDGNLSKRALITTRSKLFQDIDLTFINRPSGDIFKKTEAAAVKQAVKNLILTNYNEKPFKPNYGAGIQGLLFELADDETADDINIQIRQAIENYEPRASVRSLKVQAYPDNYNVLITLEFQVKNTEEIVVLETAIARLR
jgi:phage baseplate assembly protein W